MTTPHPHDPPKPTAFCERCGDVFVKTFPWKRFCSAACQYKLWIRKHPRIGVGRTR